MNSELSLKEEIEIYINNNITPSELFILRLLFLAIDGDSSLLTNYLANVTDGKNLFKAVLTSLKDKGIIDKSTKDPIAISKKFNSGFENFRKYCEANNISFFIYLHAEKDEINSNKYSEQDLSRHVL